jgi:DNA repair exonuclease SbcCD ATPase subunit
MLGMDEPTAGLDERSLDCLENALLGLGQLAKARGYQVIIITHEKCLERVFDQVLTLEKVM